MRLALCSITALAWSMSAGAEVHEERFYGYAFDLKSSAYLYTEVHHHRYDDERWLSGTISYFAADGRPLGHKELDFAANSHVPTYRLELASGYLEGIEHRSGDRIVMLKRADGASEVERKELRTRQPVTADSGFHAFVVDNFPALQAGTVEFTFVAAGNLDSYRFRARSEGETQFDGQPAVKIMVEPASMLRLFVKPLQLVYDREGKRLLEYRGLSNLHDPATGKPWQVRIDFFSAPPDAAPRPLPPLE